MIERPAPDLPCLREQYSNALASAFPIDKPNDKMVLSSQIQQNARAIAPAFRHFWTFCFYTFKEGEYHA